MSTKTVQVLASAADSPARLRDLTPDQWKSGIAAWLGWMFDGLDMHLYTLVATPFVALLLHVDAGDAQVGYYSSWIQASFMLGWALGGGLFGRLGDRIGRSRALTLLTNSSFPDEPVKTAIGPGVPCPLSDLA